VRSLRAEAAEQVRSARRELAEADAAEARGRAS
jgi:hypothetical protein